MKNGSILKYGIILVTSIFINEKTSANTEGTTLFIPIVVGDITTFIPILPRTNTINLTTSESGYEMNWTAVTNAAYYLVIIMDTEGNQQLITVYSTSFFLSTLGYGYYDVKVKACNRYDQCGLGYELGNVFINNPVSLQHSTSYMYDVLGRLIQVKDVSETGDSTTKYIYDKANNRTSISTTN